MSHHVTQLHTTHCPLRREQEGLLTSEEIKSLRKKSGLTQEQLSLLLGMAPKTIARYENGIAVQSRSTDFLLRLLRDNPSNLTYLSNYASLKPSSETENLSTESAEDQHTSLP